MSLNEKELSSVSVEELGFINVYFENMTDEEKTIIKSSMTSEDISKAEEFIERKMESIKRYSQFIEKFEPIYVVQLSLYERYILFAVFHHLSMLLRNRNRVHSKDELELFTMKNFNEYYIANQKLIQKTSDVLNIIGKIQEFKMGIEDHELSEQKKIMAIQNSINKIVDFLKKVVEKNRNNKEAIKLLNSFIGEEAYSPDEILDFS